MYSQRIYKIVIIILSMLVLYQIITRSPPIFWDFNVYTRAVNDYTHNINPYRNNTAFPFIYHPYVLKLFVSIDQTSSLKAFLVAFYVLSTVFFIKQLIEFCRIESLKYQAERPNSIIWFLAASVSYGGAGIIAFLTGNITPYIHFLILGLFFSSFNSKKTYYTILFLFCIVLASTIKPYFLAYLMLLPFLLSLIRSIFISLIIVVSVLAIWYSGIYTTKELYEKFTYTLLFKTLGQGDLGYAVFGLARSYLSDKTSLIIHIVTLFAMIISAGFLAKRSYSALFVPKMIPITIMIIIFSNPRMKEYDFFLSVLFLYIFLYIYSHHTALKAVTLSIFIASLPIIYGDIFGYTTHLLQILGLLVPIFYFIKSQIITKNMLISSNRELDTPKKTQMG